MREASFALSLGGFAFVLAVIWGGPFVEVLRRLGVGKKINIYIQDKHRSKMGTPTMGGLMIIIPVLMITGALNFVNVLDRTFVGRSVLVPVSVMILFGGLGMLDDWEGIRGARVQGQGLSAIVKFLLQAVFALGAAVVLMFALDIHSVALPGIATKFDLGLYYLPIATFIIVGTSNAVNFTDGLDGLAGIIAASAFAAYGVVALLQGQVFLVRLCFTVVGACFAFLWFNAHPAQLFMGDTGSLALGALLGTVALLSGQWLILPVIAIVPVAEVGSVLLQVASVQITRLIYGRGNERRIFLITPLHHHFENSGWSETQIVQRFWLVGILSSMIGIALALL